MNNLESSSNRSADYDIHWLATIDTELFDGLQEALRPSQRAIYESVKLVEKYLPNYNLLAEKYNKPRLPLPPTLELIRVMQFAYWQHRRL